MAPEDKKNEGSMEQERIQTKRMEEGGGKKVKCDAAIVQR